MKLKSKSIIWATNLLFLAAWIYGCSPSDTKQTPNEAQLAQQHCGSCHVFPDPSLLPKNIWTQKVLPNMATRMGIPKAFPFDKLSAEDVQAVIDAKVIPQHPILPLEDMGKIVQYYMAHAPKKPLPQQRTVQPQATLGLFVARPSASKAMSTMNVMLKPLGVASKIIIGTEDKKTQVYDFKTKKYQALSASISPDAVVWNNKLYVFDIISIDAHNLAKDFIWEFPIENGEIIDKPRKVIENLIRPVNMDIADLNRDNRPDFVVAEFGDYLGALTLFLSDNEGYKKQVLNANPGACKVIFKDMNDDDRLDIVALMSQGREEISLFLSNEDYTFEEKIVARFPPCYGSNSLKLVDFNKDGKTDIVMTNGDNADISSSPKAYHGVRILINKGAQKFEQQWFYPIYGASEVVSNDFDNDGDEDLVVISHFPHFQKNPDENLVYFKNEGNGKLTPFTLPKPLNGRLLALSEMDVDADGDSDLLIGNHIDFLGETNGEIIKKWQSSPTDWWILENKTIAKNK